MSNRPGDREQGELAVKTRPKTQRPPMYKVLLLNELLRQGVKNSDLARAVGASPQEIQAD